MQADMDVVSNFLRNHYVQVYSGIVDMRSDKSLSSPRIQGFDGFREGLERV